MTLTLCLAILLAFCSSGHSQSFQDNVRAALASIEQNTKLLQEDQTQLKKDVDRIRKELNESLEVIKVDVAKLEKDHNKITELAKVSRNCQDIFASRGKRSGTYRISPDGLKTIKVYCENDKFGGGWTVIQRRINGSVSFNKTWLTYLAGFGSVDGEHWLGTENIYQLTKTKVKHLKIEMIYEDTNETHYADYSTFWLKSGADFYRLNIGGFSSSSLKYDAMHISNNHQFSTFDKDRDACAHDSCASTYEGGWWYDCCSKSYLNGLYGAYMWFDGFLYKTPSAVRMMVK